MTLKSRLCGALVLALSAATPAAVVGAEFPTKTIMIYTASAGGTAGFMARLIGDNIDLGQPVVIVNKGSAVSAQTVAEADPDGHSLLILGKSFYLAPIFKQDIAYDPVKDFVPIARLATAPNVLVTHPSMPESLDEIIELAKSKPGVLNYATGASGGAAHLAGELLKDLAGIDLTRIVYKGGGPSMVGVAANESQLTFGTVPSVAPLVKSGKMRAVAVTSAAATDLMPDLPPVSKSVPGFEATSTQGIWATADTPPEVVDRLNQEIKRILAAPDVREKLAQAGMEAGYTSSAEFAKMIDADIALTTKLEQASKK